MISSPRALRVLVVDDELLIRWSIAQTLQAAGHTVVEAEDGGSALRRLAGDGAAIDAIVLDYRLPDSSDLTLLAKLRALAPGCPVIMMSAYGTPEMIQGAQRLGVQQVLTKPFEMGTLLEALVAASRPVEH